MNNTLQANSKKYSANSLMSYHLSNSAWEWNSPDTYSETQLKDILNTLQKNNVQTIYLTFGEYVDMTELPEGDEKRHERKKVIDMYRTYIRRAYASHIAVQALIGNTNWTEPDYQYLTTSTLQAIEDYNQSVDKKEQITGVQYDIEAYNLPDFTTRKEEVLTTYLQSIDKLMNSLDLSLIRSEMPNFHMGFAIPYWFDGENKNIPKVTFGKNTDYPAFLLFKILSQSENNYVVIMDYKNTALGTYGSIASAQDEINYANAHTSNVQVFLGQELNDETPPSITFYGTSKEKLLEETYHLLDAFSSSPTFAGLAFHEVSSLINLK